MTLHRSLLGLDVLLGSIQERRCVIRSILAPSAVAVNGDVAKAWLWRARTRGAPPEAKIPSRV